MVAELGGKPLIVSRAARSFWRPLIDGGPSRNFSTTKSLMYGDPPLWNALLAAG